MSATCACRRFVRYLKSSRWNVGVVLVEKPLDGAGLPSLAMKCEVVSAALTSVRVTGSSQTFKRVIRVAKWSVRDLIVRVSEVKVVCEFREFLKKRVLGQESSRT